MRGPGSVLSRRRLVLLVFVSLALTLGVRASQAHAAVGFLPAQTLAGTGPASSVRTAMASNGFAVAAWVESEAGSVSAIRVSVRPPGGPWTAPQLLDAGAVTARRFVSVAVDTAGDAAVAWENDAGSAHDTLVATREVPQQTFGSPQRLAGLSGPAVGLDASGLVTLVGNHSGAQLARTWPVGGPVPAAAQTLGSNCSGALNQLAVAPSGAAIAGFDCSGGTFALRGAGAGWAPASTPYPNTALSCGASLKPVTRLNTSDLRVAIDAAGDPFAVVLEAVRTLTCPLNLPVDSFALNLLVGNGTSMQPAHLPVVTGATLSAPDVAAAAGGALVSWGSPAALPSSPPTLPGSPPALTTGSDQHVRGFDARGNAVTPAQVVGQSAVSARGVLALSETGYALDVFPRPDGSLVGSFIVPRGAFVTPVALGSSTNPGSAAIDDSGDGVAGFAGGTGTAVTARVSGFDATAPQLILAAVPKRAMAGTPVAFSASATDFWGPVTVVWSFGDGSTARGPSVRHVFAAAGHVKVTATAIDGVGNSVGASAAVGVSRSVPVVSRLTETHSTFRVGSAGTAIRAAARSRRPPVGTIFGFTLNEDAAVAVRIDHTAAGLRSGHRCVAPSRRVRASNHRSCTRTVVDGTLQRHGHLGRNRIGFSGRIGRRALGRGAHRVTVLATAGPATGRSRPLKFVIVR